MASRRIFAFAGALAIAMTLAACQPKAVEGQSQVADGVRFEYGLAASQQVGEHPSGHEEAAMHGGPLQGPNAYHVTLALFDAKTGARITDAVVTYEISGPGHPGVGAMPMAPMTINADVSYGAYETLPAATTYRVTFTAKQYGPPSRTARAAFLVQRPGAN